MRSSGSSPMALLCVVSVIITLCAGASRGTGLTDISVRHVRSLPCKEPGTDFAFSPLGLSFGVMGELYVIDADNSRILLLSDSLDSMVPFAHCPEEFRNCQFIDVEADPGVGLYVSEKSEGRIMVFDRKGVFISDFQAGEGIGGMSADKAGRIYVAMTISGTIRIIDTDNRTDGIDCAVSDNTESAYPVDCLVGRTDRMFVTDASSKQVHILSLLGSRQGSLRGFDFRSPFGITSCLGRFILISDSELGVIAVFTSGGEFIDTFGQGLLAMPTFIASRDDGTVCVADPGSVTIEVFKIEELAVE